jgi:protein phosphatase
MKITLPKYCLVLLIGSSGAGKSTFARKHFLITEVVSSDFCRSLVCDDENNQLVSRHAFDLLYYIVEKRLLLGKLTIVDATNVQESARKALIEIAKRYNCLIVAIVLNMTERLCKERDRKRAYRHVGERVIENHIRLLKKSLGTLRNEGFSHVYILNSEEEVKLVEIKREG